MRGFFIRLIGNKKRQEIKKENIKRVLIGGGKIGDLMVKTPMIRELKKSNPDIKIDVVVDKSTRPLMQNCSHVNELLEIKPKAKIKIMRIINNLKFSFDNRKKYDLSFDFTNNVTFVHMLATRILAPKYLVGFPRARKYGIKKDELTIYDQYIERLPGEHFSEVGLKFLKCMGMESANTKYEIFLGQNLEHKYENYFDKNYINIIFNFRGGTEKRSLSNEEIDFFLKEILKLDKRIKLYILTIPSDYSAMERRISELKDERVILLPKTGNILEAAAIVKYGDMLVSVDTGIIHIASAYNLPIVAIYPKSEKSIELFGPRTDIYKIIMGKKDGYTIEGFDRDEVLDSINEIMKMNLEKRR